MNLQVTNFLVHLSHRWFPLVWLIFFIVGLAWLVSVLVDRRVQTVGDVARSRISRPIRAAASVAMCLSCGTCTLSGLHLGCAQVAAQRSTCMSNLKEVGMAVLTYAQDYDETFPRSTEWSDLLQGPRPSGEKIGLFDKSLHCPSSSTPWGYGYSRGISAKKIAQLEEPARTVLFFDANSSLRSFSGGISDTADRHIGGSNFVFADGHAKWQNRLTIHDLIWDIPEPSKPRK